MTDILGENLIIDMALKAASEATQKYLDDHPDHWYPCGFAWVKIRPARGPLVKALKERDLGRNDTCEGGLQVYNPSGNNTQCMDAKQAGARAFADVLKQAYPNLKIYAQTRID